MEQNGNKNKTQTIKHSIKNKWGVFKVVFQTMVFGIFACKNQYVLTKNIQKQKRFKKAFKTVLKTLGIGVFVVEPVLNLTRELVEEFTTENHIINYDFVLGSFVVANNDPRTPMQIYEEAIDVAVNYEGMQQVYENEKEYSYDEKTEFLRGFAKEVSASAGLKLKGVTIINFDPDTNGMALAYNNKKINISADRLLLSKDFVEETSLRKCVDLLMEEVFHYIEGQNVLLNKNTGEVDLFLGEYLFRLYNKLGPEGEEVYTSSPQEIVAKFLVDKYQIAMHEKYGNVNHNYEYYEVSMTLSNILSEIISNDIKINGSKKEDFKKMTCGEVLMVGIERLYDETEKEFTQESFEGSYLYRFLNEVIYDYMLDVNYQDFKNGFGNINDVNLETEYSNLIKNLESYDSGQYENIVQEKDIQSSVIYSGQELARSKIVRDMAKMLAVIRYRSQDFSLKTNQNALNVISQNLDMATSDEISYYRFDNLPTLKNANPTYTNFEYFANGKMKGFDINYKNYKDSHKIEFDL